MGVVSVDETLRVGREHMVCTPLRVVDGFELGPAIVGLTEGKILSTLLLLEVLGCS